MKNPPVEKILSYNHEARAIVVINGRLTARRITVIAHLITRGVADGARNDQAHRNLEIVSTSPPLIIIRMHLLVRRNRALFGELDHMHARRIARCPARPAFQRRLQFPDRRVARPADVFERDAGFGFTAMALDL